MLEGKPQFNKTARERARETLMGHRPRRSSAAHWDAPPREVKAGCRWRAQQMWTHAIFRVWVGSAFGIPELRPDGVNSNKKEQGFGKL